jgi:hypothetical protein
MMNRMKVLLGAAGFAVAAAVWAAVSVRVQANFVAEGDFHSAEIGSPPPKPWQCSKNTGQTRVAVETPPGRPEGERWVRLVDDSEKENANIRQGFAPVTNGWFQARVICQREGGRLFFNFGSGSAAKPEERAFQLVIEADGSLVVRGEKRARTSLQIKSGQTYVVRCDFETVKDGGWRRVVAELIEEGAERVSRAETGTAAVLPVRALRVTSTGPDTGVDYFVTDLSLVGR